MGHSGAAISANESVRGTGGETQNEGDQVPSNRAQQASEEDLLIDELDVNHALANGAGDGGAENAGGNEIPESGPEDGAEGREHAGGDHGGNGVGGIVPAVREFEGQGEENDDDEEGKASHDSRLGFGRDPTEIPRFARNDGARFQLNRVRKRHGRVRR